MSFQSNNWPLHLRFLDGSILMQSRSPTPPLRILWGLMAWSLSRLPDQLVNKSVSQGFCFNILCVGETGLGKSTLMDTLFNTKVEGEPATHTRPGVQLQSNTYDLQESNMGLKLPVVNMVGFRDQINKEDSYEPIVEFIEAQSEAYL
ncbi:hypothetical protein JEQ12_003787 [Ovis aries]|uniref:Septin-type G domain-containing protein n=1 Tax=Ovis aries TaxID=9940 RepID=A0A836CX71_SHEEP|nr:hypothetical protein JEQ12_003787 [Ovis aries]